MVVGGFMGNCALTPHSCIDCFQALQPAPLHVLRLTDEVSRSRLSDATKSFEDEEIQLGIGPVLTTEGLDIYAVTWNMNGRIPGSNLAELLVPPDKRRYDLYSIGLQESPSTDLDQLEQAIQKILGNSYMMVTVSNMNSLQLFVFARKAIVAYIENPQTDKVNVGGLGSLIGRQKGAVAVSLRYRRFTLLFITCHLAAHEERMAQRNAQVERIRDLTFAKPSGANRLANTWPCLRFTANAVVTNLCLKSENSCTVDGADLVIWTGDMNYRVLGRRMSVDVLIAKDSEKLLRKRDQLIEQLEQGSVFNGFVEAPLDFKPTYKFDVGTDNYDTSSKARIPSWTDRILLKTQPKGSLSATIHEYNSINSLKSSDHRPVKAVIRVDMRV